MPKWFRRGISWLWAGVIFALVIILIVKERAGIFAALPFLRQANYWFLAALAGLEVIYFLFQAFAVKILYRLYNRSAKVLPVTAMLFQSTMLNEILPTSGASGTAGFIYWGERLGLSIRDSVGVTIWLTALTYIALLPIVAICIRTIGLLPKSQSRLITGALESAFWFSIALIVVLIALYRYTVRNTNEFHDLPMENQSRIRYYIKLRISKITAWLRQAFVSYTKGEIGKELRMAKAHPWALVSSAALLTAIYAVRVLMLELSFVALHTPLSLLTATYVYALTLLFSVVSLAPTTLGVVEVALTATLGWFGVPLPIAVAGTILYRVASFWLPIPVGLVSQWYLSYLAHSI